jgi:MFS family permease
VAGVIITVFNEGWCFFIDGVSYIAVIGGLLAMTRADGHLPTKKFKGAWEELREGARYVWESHAIRSIIMLLALTSLLGLPYAVLMPVFAKTVLGGGAHALGFLLASSGAGALIGALWLASRKSAVGLGKWLPLSVSIFSSAVMAFSFSRNILLSMALLILAGFGFIVQVAGSNTIIQTIVDEDKRGRVLSYFMMAFLGTAPVGSFLYGALASRVGAPWTVFSGGALCLVAAFIFTRQLPAIRAAIRPIYVRLGILPEISSGLENKTYLTNTPEQ